MIFLHLLQVVTSATLLTETFDGGNFTFFGSIPAKITIEPNLRHLKGFWDIESSDYKKVTFSSFWIKGQRYLSEPSNLTEVKQNFKSCLCLSELNG